MEIRITIFRITSGILGLFLLVMAPVIIIAAEGWQKFGAIPGILLGTLFLVKAIRW
jgi:hypothetical protein